MERVQSVGSKVSKLGAITFVGVRASTKNTNIKEQL